MIYLSNATREELNKNLDRLLLHFARARVVNSVEGMGPLDGPPSLHVFEYRKKINALIEVLATDDETERLRNNELANEIDRERQYNLRIDVQFLNEQNESIREQRVLDITVYYDSPKDAALELATHLKEFKNRYKRACIIGSCYKTKDGVVTAIITRDYNGWDVDIIDRETLRDVRKILRV